MKTEMEQRVKQGLRRDYLVRLMRREPIIADPVMVDAAIREINRKRFQGETNKRISEKDR